MAREVVARTGAVQALLRPAESPHPGLVFDRFPRVIGKVGGHFEIPGGARSEWLGEFIRLAEFNRDPGETSVRATRLATVHARLDHLTRAAGGQRREFRTAWRFATGLGNPNAAEIGFSFDPACGVPVLPGSAVKGLARSGARLCDAPSADQLLLLGEGPEDTDSGCAGALVFLDALPTRWPRLEVDIITRHHDAEALSDQKVPLDTDAPNPVHFLAVAPGQTFAFRLLPRPGAPEHALPLAWTWLERALDDLGAGAKTAVGYGQMLPA